MSENCANEYMQIYNEPQENVYTGLQGLTEQKEAERKEVKEEEVQKGWSSLPWSVRRIHIFQVVEVIFLLVFHEHWIYPTMD